MTLEGSLLGLLHGLHAEGCDGTEYSACRPVVVPSHREPTYYDQERGADLEVVLMAWCSECAAADWEVV